MEQSAYQRLEEFWRSKGLKSPTAFAEATGVKAATLSAIKQRGSLPSNAVMLAIQQTFPDLNPDYILWGAGSMLREGRVLAPRLPPAPGLTSGAATVAEAENLLLRAEVERQQLQIERLWDMLGKSPGSSDATGHYYPLPVPQAPAPGFRTAAIRQELAEQFNAFVEEELDGVEVGR